MVELRSRSAPGGENKLDHQMSSEKSTDSEKKGVKGDVQNILVLLFLYILQGIPLGLAAAIPLILTNRNVSYKQQAEFSFSYWPFSVKLLWAPIVDSCFVKSFGRRKSWLVPIQYLIGVTMYVLSHNVNYYLGEPEPGAEEGATSEPREPNLTMLTAMFFFLNFLAATQDIAVDGWALTMLQKHNVGYASTCNSVGQTAGYFMGYVFFMALESYGYVTLPGFLKFWAVVFTIATTLVAVLKHEKEEDFSQHEDSEEIGDLGVVDTYKLLVSILKLGVMPATIAMLLTSKIGFAATDAVTGLKLVEKGVPKDKLAMLAIPMIPLQIILPWVISKYTSGPRPMDVFTKAIPARLAMGPVMAWLVYVTPSWKQDDGEFPVTFYLMMIVLYALHQVTLYSMFVSIMAFFAQVSDPAVGGTYMTLLNTITNLGGNWPSTLALWCVDTLTLAECKGQHSEGGVQLHGTCVGKEGAEQCHRMGGTCNVYSDGYYVEVVICVLIGCVWYLVWGSRTIKRLQDQPQESWRVVKQKHKR
eukprot:TRINITY_DN3429_c0_g2_i4.p1 TRINITY_DN3429_c0_g2~~TRINITY_DN3429_c0_g2_i4.p1  ORF type:complete len:529 (+),score=65.39 TRINITY_DN3429_c0_g2_i4:57-1643(+)